MALLGGAIVFFAAFVVYLGWSHFRFQSQPSARRPMLAVLPFENLTGDAQDYFSDGLTEEMISQLGRLNPQRFGVIARTSVMHYKSSQASLDQIARELGAEYVLEGSVRRDSDRVRITAQLIQIELNPSYVTAHHWYGEYLGLMGRFDEAFREMEWARQLDPLSLIVASDNAVILFYSGQYDRAISQFRSVEEMEPNFPRAHVVILAYVQKGLYADALAYIQRWQRIEESPWSWAMLAYVYGSSGQRLQARSALERLQQLNRRRHISAASIFSAYMGMGDKDQAFVWLNQAVAEHSVDPSLKVSPFYAPLRGDPRFQDLMRRVGLAQ
jgi:TolB-like protein